MSPLMLVVLAVVVLLVILIEVWMHERNKHKMVADYRNAMTKPEQQLPPSFEARRIHLQRVQQGLIDEMNKLSQTSKKEAA